MSRLLEGLLRLLARVPLPLLHALGGGLGWLGAWIPNRARHVTAVNLALCFPEMPPGQRRRLLRRSLQETARGLLELGPLWYRPPQAVCALVRETVDEHLFEDALARGRGILWLAPHLGAWELGPIYCMQRIPVHALYRPPRQGALEPVLIAARERCGAHLAPASAAGVRQLLRALRSGEAVGILPDQQPPGEGVFAPFFGVPAKTMTLLPRLAGRTDAAVLAAFAERLPRGRGYRLHFQQVDPAVASDDPAQAARVLNRAVENAVRVCAEQYLWSYRRFSRRPDGGPAPYGKSLRARLRRLRRRLRA